MAIFNPKYLKHIHEKYVSKYADDVKDIDIDEEDNDDELDDDDKLDEEWEKRFKSSVKKSDDKDKKDESKSDDKDKKEEPKSSDKEDDKKSKEESDKKTEDNDQKKEETSKPRTLFQALKGKKDNEANTAAKQGTDDEKIEYKYHLSKEEITKALDIIKVYLSNHQKLKKCCDYIDLSDKDKINDNGDHVSSYDNYYAGKSNAFLQLVDGEVWDGYPDFKEGGDEQYDKDVSKLVKDINEKLKDQKLPVKFVKGSIDNNETISFGIKSTKEHPEENKKKSDDDEDDD